MHQNCHDHFRKHCSSFIRQPSQERYCADKCCCVIYILASILFLSLGIYYITSANYSDLMALNITEYPAAVLLNFDLEEFPDIITSSWITVAAAYLLTLILFFALKSIPRFTLYLLVWGGVLGFLLLIIIIFAHHLVALGVLMCLVFLVFLIFVGCTQQRIRDGVLILKITSVLLKQNLSKIFVPVMIFVFLAILFEAFWFYSFMGIAAHHGWWERLDQVSRQQKVNTGMLVLWVFFHFFYAFILYNCAVFLVGNACSSSFYQQKNPSLCRGICQIIRYHLGSFTFAYFLSVPVALLRQTAECDQRGNVSGCGLYACLLSCCLKFVEGTFQVINHNSILVMSISGQNYINSARTALSLVSYNLKLFFLIDYISTLISLAGMVSLSAFAGLFAFVFYQFTSELSAAYNMYFPIGIIAVMLMSSTIACIMFTAVSQTLSCVFILYCLQRRFQENELECSSSDGELGPIFRELEPHIETSDRQRNNQKQIRELAIKTLENEAKKKGIKGLLK